MQKAMVAFYSISSFHYRLSYIGPDNWCKEFPAAAGCRQSPINILTNSTVFDSELAENKLTFTIDPVQSLNQALHFTGHNFKIETSTDSSNSYFCHSSSVEYHSSWQWLWPVFLEWKTTNSGWSSTISTGVIKGPMKDPSIPWTAKALPVKYTWSITIPRDIVLSQKPRIKKMVLPFLEFFSRCQRYSFYLYVY